MSTDVHTGVMTHTEPPALIATIDLTGTPVIWVTDTDEYGNPVGAPLLTIPMARGADLGDARWALATNGWMILGDLEHAGADRGARGVIGVIPTPGTLAEASAAQHAALARYRDIRPRALKPGAVVITASQVRPVRVLGTVATVTTAASPYSQHDQITTVRMADGQEFEYCAHEWVRVLVQADEDEADPIDRADAAAGHFTPGSEY